MVNSDLLISNHHKLLPGVSFLNGKKLRDQDIFLVGGGGEEEFKNNIFINLLKM